MTLKLTVLRAQKELGVGISARKKSRVMFFFFGLFRTTNQLLIPDSRLSVLQNTGYPYLGLGLPDSKSTYLYRVTGTFPLDQIQQKASEMNVSR